MNTHQMAKALGRLGGKARAKSLSADQKRRIASLGGKLRWLSEQAPQRVHANFRYLEAVRALRKAAKKSLHKKHEKRN